MEFLLLASAVSVVCCLLTFEKLEIFALFWDSKQMPVTPWWKPDLMHLRSLMQFKCAL